MARAALTELSTCLEHERKASAASECHSVTLERLLEEVMAGNMILPKMVILEHSELLN